MQDRHKDDEMYFKELAKGTGDYVIPYIESVKKIPENSVVLEIGCGQGGNLYPFLEKGCRAIGIDKNDGKVGFANDFFKNCKNAHNLTLLNMNFYEVDPNSLPKADFVLIRDVLEHIVNREAFFERLKEFLADGAVIFNAFPPWRMPFGGHQQGLKNRLLSKLPWFHLLPCCIFELILKIAGEDEKLYKDLLRDEVRRTKLSIREYKKLLKKSGFEIEKETYYLVNPSYKLKFGLKPRILPGILKIPFLCDFYTTAHYSVITKIYSSAN
ncbi:MAG: class I SAM-dependent methyltransferase [Chitinispirillales bacterium]|jgi:2-polyprenyl-3-methyl-5-hydroxy-6-metoxy-1,4-benzoquinol methylase|nr:class I SAM-dependent methyltransferase [Chitinispirillales bacterium]